VYYEFLGHNFVSVLHTLKPIKTFKKLFLNKLGFPALCYTQRVK